MLLLAQSSVLQRLPVLLLGSHCRRRSAGSRFCCQISPRLSSSAKCRGIQPFLAICGRAPRNKKRESRESDTRFVKRGPRRRSPMTTIQVTSDALSETDHHTQLRRAVIASTVGTTIEWYDFLLYSTV